jgi:hypothetical protein
MSSTYFFERHQRDTSSAYQQGFVAGRAAAEEAAAGRDSYRAIAVEAIECLIGEEYTTESQFGVGNDDFHGASRALQARLDALDKEETT